MGYKMVHSLCTLTNTYLMFMSAILLLHAFVLIFTLYFFSEVQSAYIQL